ncbi:MAG: HAD-IIA family hydrolase [Anaerolineae bacterium]|nr:HAD-IIA family hydrolase [Anaerolineae bacterium]
MNIKTLQTLLIDGDGVLWEADDPMPGLVNFFDVLERSGIAWALLTNNATRTTEAYVEKLRSFGVTARLDQIFTSGNVTAHYLRDLTPPAQSIYVIGQPDLKTTLQQAGFTLFDGEEEPEPVDAVVAGIDRAFTYAKLRVAMRLIRNGAVYIATNPDTTFPTPQGLVPGAGSVIAAVTAAAGREPVWMGKPEPTMYQVAMKHFGADLSTTAILGDRMETDILGGQRLGMGTILVLSGITSREDLAASDIRPDYIFEGIAALADELEKVRA